MTSAPLVRAVFDCDGFLSNFVAGALDVVHLVTGKRHQPLDVKTFDFCGDLGLDKRARAAVYLEIQRRRGFCASLEPYKEAIASMPKAREIANIHVVTAPWPKSETWAHEREEWLRRHFEIDDDHVHHSRDKSLYDADLFVDDRSDLVRAWLAAHPGKEAVFWRTSHNTAESVPAGASSIGSWSALIGLMRSIAMPRQKQQEMLHA